MDPRTEKMLTERAQKAAAIPPLLRGPVRALDDAKVWVKVNGTLAKIGAGVAAILVFAAYYVFVALPAQRFDQRQIDARAADRLRSDVAAGQIAADECLSKAQAEADARWNAACKTRRERAGCALPARLTENLQQQESQARNACLIRSSVTSQ